MTWIVTADSTRCRIYQLDESDKKLELIKEFTHPDAHLKKGEYLTDDKPGRYKSDASQGGGSYSPHSDPKEVIVDNFARTIATELNRGRNAQAYKKIITVCLPHMKGLLYKHLDKHVKELISQDIEKDVMHLAPHELIKIFHPK
jgi:protein required for attachment to host cells